GTSSRARWRTSCGRTRRWRTAASSASRTPGGARSAGRWWCCGPGRRRPKRTCWGSWTARSPGSRSLSRCSSPGNCRGPAPARYSRNGCGKPTGTAEPQGVPPSPGVRRENMLKYVIMRVPGSGKSSEAAILAADLDLVHISVGDIFRWNVQHHTKMGAQVRRVMAAGELVGDDLAEAVTAERLAQHDWNYGFVIDGFPRNARQAE